MEACHAATNPAAPARYDTRMNDELRFRLYELLEPDHECTPYNGGCEMPRYRYNITLPRYLDQWPDYSVARQKLEEVRELRDWPVDVD